MLKSIVTRALIAQFLIIASFGLVAQEKEEEKEKAPLEKLEIAFFGVYDEVVTYYCQKCNATLHAIGAKAQPHLHLEGRLNELRDILFDLRKLLKNEKVDPKLIDRKYQELVLRFDFANRYFDRLTLPSARKYMAEMKQEVDQLRDDYGVELTAYSALTERNFESTPSNIVSILEQDIDQALISNKWLRSGDARLTSNFKQILLKVKTLLEEADQFIEENEIRAAIEKLRGIPTQLNHHYGFLDRYAGPLVEGNQRARTEYRHLVTLLGYNDKFSDYAKLLNAKSKIQLVEPERPKPATRLVEPESVKLEWLSSYGKAIRKAKEEKRLVLISFYSDTQKFKLESEAVDLVSEFILVEVPLSYKLKAKGQTEPKRLLDFKVFRNLENNSGLAVINLKYPNHQSYYRVVGSLKIDDVEKGESFKQFIESAQQKTLR